MNMLVLAWSLLGLSALLELLGWSLPAAWARRQLLAGLAVFGLMFATGVLLSETLSGWSILVAVVSVYRVVNLLRVAKARLEQAYLRRVVARTSAILALVQLLLGLWWLVATREPGMMPLYIEMLAVLLVITSALVALSVLVNIYRSRTADDAADFADADLPSLTVAIPARDETADLRQCLDGALASDYPKLEVLVYDDCSQDKTPDIIRKLAHRGVRFINGQEPDERWLAKNQAYDVLADHASGKLILFCGADVRFQPHTLRTLVAAMLAGELKMMSVLPRREHSALAAMVVQPMRYWWELALPRFAMREPASLSTAWIIDRKTLKKLGGMEAVARSVRPEDYFARETHRLGVYRFMIAAKSIGLTSTKSPAAQLQTAIRLRYPESRRQPEHVLGLSLLEALFLLAPFVLLGWGVLQGNALLVQLAVISCLLLTVAHVSIVAAYSPGTWWIAAFNLPLMVLAEIFLVNESMRRYEFGSVRWKGRNICIPVLQAIPRLPRLPHRH